MTKQTFTQKSNGDTLSASEWNNLTSYVNTAVDAINNGAASGGAIDTNGVISVSSKGNVTVSSNKNVNVEPAWSNNVSGYSGNYGDVAIKPGDDIQFCSHHREPKKRDKVVIKNLDGSDNPVKLEVYTGELTLSTKGKAATRKKNNTTGEDISNQALFDKAGDDKVMDVRIVTGVTLDENTNNERDERGYLKVRAQAIDLRCEKHGGIALQPKGYDGVGNMNKIKFEHGGGDGLEFGTFNTDKTSIFTNEYRFNREGIWKMATRETEASGKTILDEREGGLQGLPATAAYKYVKQADDFYDIISNDDEQCTTKDIIKTAFAMNGGKDRHTKITNKGAIEIATNPTYTITIEEAPVEPATATEISTISTKIAALDSVAAGDVFNEGDFTALPVAATVYTNGTQYFSFTEVAAPSIKIESGAELKLGGILDFGSSFNFGETDNGVEFQYKLTKKNAEKDCGIVKVVGVNNHATNDLTVEGVTIAPGQTATIAQCSMLDIIKLVNYMKTNNQGPWTASQS